MFQYFSPLFLRLILLFADPFLHDPPKLTWANLKNAPVVKASRYGDPRDGRHGGRNPVACAPDYRIEEGMHVIAHRTLPCGTIIAVESVRTGRQTIGVVMDRGPFGAYSHADGKWFAKVGKKKHIPGDYRGEFDLAYSMFYELGLKGISPVRYKIIYRPKKPVKIRPQHKERNPV